MQVQPALVAAGAPGQLIHRPNAFLVMAGLAFPHRQGRTPVAFTAERPVDIVFQPVSEPAILDMPRVPVDPLIELYQLVAVLAGADVPGRPGIV